MRIPISWVLAPVCLVAASPAAAEVAASSDAGFVSHNEAVVTASPEQAWDAMLNPADWWDGNHTYSGNAAYLVLLATTGGCFCEAIPSSGDGPDGEIEHMRVLYMSPFSTLRLSGALGPLQSEAVTGVLTMTIEPSGTGAKLSWDYVVGGYARTPMPELAPLVDAVVGEQLSRLADRLGRP